jgi:hypothetical protein
MTIEEMVELAKNEPDKYEIRYHMTMKMLTNPYKGIYTHWIYENGVLVDTKEVPKEPIVIPTLYWW